MWKTRIGVRIKTMMVMILTRRRYTPILLGLEG
jgi:hypothetical protein